MGLIKMNTRILHVLNSCDRREFWALMDEVIRLPHREKLFTSKLYVWNWIRPRDFYKMMAQYTVDLLEADPAYEAEGPTHEDYLRNADFLIKMVLRTAQTEAIKKSFIWNIMKSVPLLTVDTIQFAAPEKIQSILASGKDILVDDYVRPLVDAYKAAKDEADEFRELVGGGLS